eukprot:gnl/MRDRNA2_/MRDRNA2_27516_c0_seq1.p1 gnl/MRDRNA2_/MRDRNA2_27516_c0~~gnl/MRDRNA2_/MRDRNA2_27516_c0_seq1.p1  ORF type:complete len:241 (+),score=33.20 gnl/MRDRNA2_/MRDRNA2_27516_c0_seq1:76-723(+)
MNAQVKLQTTRSLSSRRDRQSHVASGNAQSKKTRGRAASLQVEHDAVLRKIQNRNASVGFRNGLGIDPDAQTCRLPLPIHERFLVALSRGEPSETIAALDYTQMTISQIQELSAKAIDLYDRKARSSYSSKLPQCALLKCELNHKQKVPALPEVMISDAQRCSLHEDAYHAAHGFRSARCTSSGSHCYDSKKLHDGSVFLAEPNAFKPWNLTVAG